MKKSLMACVLIAVAFCFTACFGTSPTGGETRKSTTTTTATTTAAYNGSSFTPVYSTWDYFETFDFYDDLSEGTVRYLFHEPLRQSDQPKPLVIFLHGRGDSVTADFPGTATPMVQSLMTLENKYAAFGTYTLVPSTPLSYEGDWSPLQITAFKALLRDVIERYNIDKNRIYISGISMGGFMTCQLVSEMPGTFAAAVPLSGARNLLSPSAAHDTAFRIYHVADDPVVNVSCSRSLYLQLADSGHPNFEYVEYSDGNHISPIYTVFEDDRNEFFTWLFSRHLP